ncbi:MAG: GntR family transcriptional regulator [Roseobacter sp.]
MPSIKSKTDILFDHIRADILSLDLSPNSALRLPALSERYHIGLTPLRECLNRLCGDHLVVPEHNKGFRVAPLNRAELLDLEHSRNAIEGELIAHAVTRGNDSWEAGIVGAFYHLSQTPVPTALESDDALSLWTRRHTAFHHALIYGSPSIWMQRFLLHLEDQLGRYHLFIQTGLRELATATPHLATEGSKIIATGMALPPHEALYAAALARDPEAARHAFDLHTGLTINAFEDLLALMPEGSKLADTLGTHSETPP